ncbi:MAG: lipopolysaccharide heptosyltransferase II [Candidatus Omnitrophica bacterium]|nr:lipopolysaccharide heptosyltransferase II [Candidatus Omnitrophota bacterium]
MRRILVVGLSNVGDAVLMSPVIERLHQRFPQAELTLLAGDRAQALFAHDPRLAQVITLDEFSGWIGRLRLVGLVWRQRPDLLIDLRQTMLPLVWKPWRCWRYFWPVPKRIVHMRTRHLWKLHMALGSRFKVRGNDLEPGASNLERSSMWISPEDEAAVETLLRRRWGVPTDGRLVVICPGARSHIKRWYADRFADVADQLIEQDGVEVIFSGEPDETPIIQEVLKSMRHPAHNAAGCTTVRQLAALMRQTSLVITNDSASLHVAGAVGTPVLALFGPTDPAKYGPTGARSRVLQRRLFCVPCEQALCEFHHECMRFLSVDEVYRAAKGILEKAGGGSCRLGTPPAVLVPHGTAAGGGDLPSASPAHQRILVIRLDRIGDVVLSTPVLQALRDAYPRAFLAMMVRPVCRELVEGNPCVNEVLLYDKDGRHRGILSTIRFARGLRRHHFDTALVLHPTNRSHWIPWLAGIPVRIGYDRKSGWLLTHRVPHRKQEGARHEAEYAVEMLRVLPAPDGGPGGLEPPRVLSPYVPIHPAAEAGVARLFQERGVDGASPLVALHPSASDASKRWPAERFAQLADRLVESCGARVVLVAGPDDARHARAVEQAMRRRPLNAAGALSVGELAVLLARCRLLVSNDSGPVHVAAAVGTPVVALFGRCQPGVNATRWRPLGPRHVVLDTSDPSRFTAIAELSVEEVFAAAISVLSKKGSDP